MFARNPARTRPDRGERALGPGPARHGRLRSGQRRQECNRHTARKRLHVAGKQRELAGADIRLARQQHRYQEGRQAGAQQDVLALRLARQCRHNPLLRPFRWTEATASL